MAKPERKLSLSYVAIIWLLRIVVGATFVISGWSKSVDPWGFIYKIEEYFNVWGLTVPREMTLALAVALSVSEFTVGVLVLTGAMRRGAVLVAAAFMAFMLPLTAYIALADPVSDCGCFGDLWVISNTVTFVKNIVLSVMIILLVKYNGRVGGVYHPGLQWLVVVGAVLFSSTLAFFGYRYQPLVDFRPYPTGSELIYGLGEEDGDASGYYIYEKDGAENRFTLDNIPDSTWTYVRAELPGASDLSARLAVFDGDIEVTDAVLDGEGDLLLLAVTDPDLHYLTRARLANELSAYITEQDGRMVALVAASGDELEGWEQLALPSYEVYSAEDTSLKELVRGDAGLVYVHDGVIVWKRNLASISHDVLLPEAGETKLLSDDMAIDDGRLNLLITGAFLLWMLIVYILNYPNRIIDKYLLRRSAKNS